VSGIVARFPVVKKVHFVVAVCVFLLTLGTQFKTDDTPQNVTLTECDYVFLSELSPAALIN